MADITDPFLAGRAGIGAQADALDTVRRSQVAMSTRECAGRLVVALSGEVDLTNAEGSAALIATVAARVPWLIIDLTGLTFIDCAGIRALAAAARQAAWCSLPRRRRCGGCLT